MSHKLPILSFFLLILPQITQALYVQPNLVIKECEWGIIGSSGYVVMPYGKYVFKVSMVGALGFYWGSISVINLENGNTITTISIKNITATADSPLQVLLCPKEKRLVIFGVVRYAVFDISNPEQPTLIKLR